MRISRPCYNKYHRCPGWAGGGTRSARVDRCDGGYINGYQKPHWRWRTNRCSKCNVLVLPFNIRYLDLRYWLKWKIPSLERNAR